MLASYLDGWPNENSYGWLAIEMADWLAGKVDS